MHTLSVPDPDLEIREGVEGGGGGGRQKNVFGPSGLSLV